MARRTTPISKSHLGNAGLTRKRPRKVKSRSDLLMDRMQREGITICEFCGATKQGLSMVLGYSSKPDWCLVAGQGVACPECYPVVSVRGVKYMDGPCSLCGRDVRIINQSSICVPCQLTRTKRKELPVCSACGSAHKYNQGECLEGGSNASLSERYNGRKIPII